MQLPDYVKQAAREAAAVSLYAASKARLPADPDAPIAICVLKNELDRLPCFFAHYRRLGVERFAMIDNGSTDGSAEYCASQPDVDLYRVLRPFVWPLKQGWISRAIQSYGYDRWYIYVDADEHLVFAGFPEKSIKSLIEVAEARGLRRVRGMLIDMYAEGPVLDYGRPKGAPLIDAFPLFDTDSYVERPFKEIISRKGGPRKRCFGADDPSFNPELTKYPLFKPRRGEIMANPHHIFPVADNFLSDCFIGLLHFKFLPGLIERVKIAIEEKTYWSGSLEYTKYLEALTADSRLSLAYAGTARYSSPDDLISAGVITPVPWETGASPRDRVSEASRRWRAERIAI